MAAKKEGVKAKSGLDLQRQRDAKFAALSTDVEVARRRAGKIRDGLRSWASTRDAIIEAFQKQDWFTLGYTSWDDYCDTEFSGGKLNLSDDDRRDAILAFASVGMTLREIGSAAGTSKDTAQRTLARSRVSSETKSPLVEALRGEIETSAAVTAANPEDASPVLGEPVDVDEQASTGTQSPPAADASTTLPHAGVPAVGDQNEERTEAEHEQDSAWHGGPGECGVGCSCGASFDGFNSVDEATDELALHIANPEERIEEEAAEPPADLPAAATTSLPDGGGDPMPEQSQQPGQDSPPVLGSEGFPGRSETDHHRAGVSGGGHAPALPGVVELETLEGGDLPAVTSSSSSDPDEEDEEPTPTDLLFRLFGALVTLIDHLDAEAVGPLLYPAELEQLHQHVDVLTAFVAKVSMAQFQASQRTP